MMKFRVSIFMLLFCHADTCMVELSWDQTKNPRTLGEHMKVAFGPSWKDLLCKNQLEAGKIEPGHPSLLVISSSALRSLELLRLMTCLFDTKQAV